MAGRWYYGIDGETHGPIPAEDLKKLADDGTLMSSDYVRREDMSEWMPAADVKGLFGDATSGTSAESSSEERAKLGAVDFAKRCKTTLSKNRVSIVLTAAFALFLILLVFQWRISVKLEQLSSEVRDVKKELNGANSAQGDVLASERLPSRYRGNAIPVYVVGGSVYVDGTVDVDGSVEVENDYFDPLHVEIENDPVPVRIER